jgi:hypothetical protein
MKYIQARRTPEKQANRKIIAVKIIFWHDYLKKVYRKKI